MSVPYVRDATAATLLFCLPADRFTVCILTAVEHHIVATLFANPNFTELSNRTRASSRFRTEAGQKPALHAWLHSGDSIGLEFREVHGTGATVSNASSN
jgi:hypothetical protein